MSERQLFNEIERVVGDAEKLMPTLGHIETLIKEYCGGAILVICPQNFGSRGSTPFQILDFLESRQFPFRGLYFAPIKGSNVSAHTLIACMGTWDIGADALRRIATFAAQQLGKLGSQLDVLATEYVEAA